MEQKKDINVSICMAVYNGEDYIEDQMNSILKQLDLDDEIIVVDDGSVDLTVEKILGLNDKRIKIHRNKMNIGHVATFEKSIKLASREYIFLSDQDDVWSKDKVGRFKNELSNGHECVVSNYEEWWPLTSSKKRVFVKLYSNRWRSFFTLMLGKMNHLGCCMAFKKDILLAMLPIHKEMDAHDRWLMIKVLVSKTKYVLIPEPLLLHRNHNNNVTPIKRRSTMTIIKSRLMYLKVAFKSL